MNEEHCRLVLSVLFKHGVSWGFKGQCYIHLDCHWLFIRDNLLTWGMGEPVTYANNGGYLLPIKTINEISHVLGSTIFLIKPKIFSIKQCKNIK